MEPARFDAITKLFAKRRLSRRTALGGAAGLTLSAVHGMALGQPASPVATPASDGRSDATRTMTLFIQSFRAGTLLPKPGEPDVYILTLSDGLGQTVYFSDRPERIVGTLPTPEFLDALGFTPDNPPNAALVAEAAEGDDDVLVVELFNPAYDRATRTATYDVRLLDTYERLGIAFREEPAGAQPAHTAFGAAHLFIDDCQSGPVSCWISGSGQVGILASAPYCFECGPRAGCGCFPQCDANTATCNQTFPACQGRCVSTMVPPS